MEANTILKRESKDDLRFLDGLRGLAALYVAIGHARWLLWEGYAEGFLRHPQQYSVFGKLLVYASALFRYGHEAVLFFFVLSGFVIHLRYAKQLNLDNRETSFDWRSYVWRRAKRLYPPLIFALALTWALDVYGARLGYPIYFQATPSPLINQNVVVHHDWLTGLGNLAFLMNSYVPAWGTDGPLWSLKFEWWFYMIYPVFWWLSKKSIRVATVLMVGLWLASFVPALWPASLLREVFSMMLAWWFGVLLADIFAGRLRWSFARLAPLILFITFLPFINLNPIISDILWGLGFTGLIAVCFAFHRKDGLILSMLGILKPLGDMSYTLYVIHFPILVLISGYVMSRTQNHQMPSHFGWAASGILLCLLVAYLAHWIVEAPFVKPYYASRNLVTPLHVEEKPLIA